MGKLLRFEFKRVRMNLFFWIITAYCVVWPILVSSFYRLVFTIKFTEGGISFGELAVSGDEKKYITWLILIAFYAEMPKFMALFTALYIGKDTGDGFIRNKIIAGHSRLSVFLTNNITQSLVCVFWCVVYVCFGALGLKINGLGPDFNGGEMFRRIATAVVVLLVFSALFTSIAMAFRNRTLPVILSILFTMLIGTVTMAIGMFNMPKQAADSYEKCCSEWIDSAVEEGVYTGEQGEALKKMNSSESARGGKPWLFIHPVYQLTNGGFQKDFNMPNSVGLGVSFGYDEDIDFTDTLYQSAFIQGVDVSRETIEKLPGVKTSYGTKCLEYIGRSVIWYVVLTAGGFVAFKRKDLF